MLADSPLGHQPTLLLVEVNELVRDDMIRQFVGEGYLVFTACTGHDAMGVLRTPEMKVDIVLLDIALPDVRGTDLCARIREVFPSLPIVVCTGAANPEEVEELLGLGIAHFLTKPIAPSDLAAAVRSAYEAYLSHRLIH